MPNNDTHNTSQKGPIDVQDIYKRLNAVEVSMAEAITELRITVKTLGEGITELRTQYKESIDWHRETTRKNVRTITIGACILFLVQIFGAGTVKAWIDHRIGTARPSSATYSVPHAPTTPTPALPPTTPRQPRKDTYPDATIPDTGAYHSPQLSEKRKNNENP